MHVYNTCINYHLSCCVFRRLLCHLQGEPYYTFKTIVAVSDYIGVQLLRDYLKNKYGI